MRAWSLRARLTALSAAVAAVVLATTAVVLLVQMRSGLVGTVDADAEGRARDVAALVVTGRLRALAALPGGAQTVVQVVDPAGQVLAGSDNVTGVGRLFAFAPETGPRTLRQVALPRDTVDFRVTAVRAGDAVVYAGAPVDDVQDGVAVLATRLAVGGPALLALLVTGVWLLVGRALRPVEVLRRQAEAISGPDLSDRLAVPAAGELGRLAATLNDLLGRAETAARQQRRFLDDAAHELRNPVAGMLAALEVHERTSDDPDAPAMTRQARRLAALVADLLTLARLDAGAGPAPRPVELARLVREQLVGRSGVSSDLVTGWVVADPGVLGRAVRNLLDNAERHAVHAVQVCLAVDDDTLVLTVSDDGPGLPAADRERVFTRFTRLDEARSREHGGVGLGLAIVAGAVAAAGGSVRVAGDGPGARFVVRLPRHRPPERA